MKNTFLLYTIIFLSNLNALGSDRLKNVNKVYDAIIVPGYPYNPNGKMNPMYKIRLYWAYHLYKNGKTKNIIVSGSAVHTPYVESKVYALYLIELGIDPSHIIIEDRAEHSLENIFYSLEIAKAHGFTSVAIASDKAHSYMIKYLDNKFGHGLETDFIPARWRYVIKKYWYKFDLNIDHSKAYQPGFVPIVAKKSKTQRKIGTSGTLWSPSKVISWSYGSTLVSK